MVLSFVVRQVDADALTSLQMKLGGDLAQDKGRALDAALSTEADKRWNDYLARQGLRRGK